MGHTNGAAAAVRAIDAEQLAAEALPLSIRQKIAADQLVEWKYALYNVTIAIKVARAIDDPAERIEQLRREAERCQKAIDTASAMIVELAAEQQTPHG